MKATIAVDSHPFIASFRSMTAIGKDVVPQFDDSVRPMHKAFRPMLLEQRFDFCEMAIATYVQGRAAGRPVWLLPVSLTGRFQHEQLRHAPSVKPFDVRAYRGARIGVRSYAQTTGVWARSILRDQVGLDYREVTWVVLEESHEAAFGSPANVEFATGDAGLVDLLLAGEVDAIVGQSGGNPAVRPVLGDAGELARQWYADKNFVSVNHIVTVAQSFLESSPAASRAIFDALTGAINDRDKTRYPSRHKGEGWDWASGVDLLPNGLTAIEPVVRYMADELHRQDLIPEPLPIDSLIHPVVRAWFGSEPDPGPPA